MSKKSLPKFEEVFENGLKVDVISNAFDLRLKGSGMYRTAYNPFNSYTIKIYEPGEWDEETDEPSEDRLVAFMKVESAVFNSPSHANNIVDIEGDDDYLCLCDAASRYEKKYNSESDAVIDKLPTIIILWDNFYISPEYRGKGLSDLLTLRMPDFISAAGLPVNTFWLERAYVVTKVNPFSKQDVVLTETTSLSTDAFGGYREIANTMAVERSLDEQTKKIASKAEKSLKRCGFKHMGQRIYCTTLDSISWEQWNADLDYYENGTDYIES